jgi:hypothetical protein
MWRRAGTGHLHRGVGRVANDQLINAVAGCLVWYLPIHKERKKAPDVPGIPRQTSQLLAKSARRAPAWQPPLRGTRAVGCASACAATLGQWFKLSYRRTNPGNEPWRNYVLPDGSISIRPRGGWGFP